jgi:DNA-binding transcriptional LysR family regulator
VRELVSENAGPLSLAMVGTLAGTQLTIALKRFARSHSKVALTLRTATSSQVSNLVRRGEAVIGVRYHRDSLSDLDSRHLGAERLVVACARNHRLAERSINSLERLKNERWLAFPEDQAETSASHVFSIFLTQGIGEPIWSPIDSLTAQKRMVEAGLGLALLQESAIREELRSRTMSTIHVRHLNAVIPITAITRRGGFLSAAARALLDLLAGTYAAN